MGKSQIKKYNSAIQQLSLSMYKIERLPGEYSLPVCTSPQIKCKIFEADVCCI